MIHPKTQPDVSRRARLFETACFKLTEWWHSNFRVIPDKGVRNQTFLEVEKQRLVEQKRKKSDLKGKGKATSSDQIDVTPYSDRLRSAKSLMKHALLREGSADTSSLLFTALCRALDVPARLIVSLQAVPWSSKSERTKPAEATVDSQSAPSASRDDSSSDDAQGSEDFTSKNKDRPAKLRRSRPKDRKPRVVRPRSSSNEPPLEGWPPVVWTEVFSRAEGRWIPIDPIRYLVDKKKLFEPPLSCRRNRMVYVVAIEEGKVHYGGFYGSSSCSSDGFARDVTLRYARSFGAKTAKTRASSRRGQSDWWARVMAILTRPYRLVSLL
jgi:xeroderma pigmentosum group C-complementing protein